MNFAGLLNQETTYEEVETFKVYQLFLSLFDLQVTVMPTASFKTNRTIIKYLSILLLFLISCEESEETIDLDKDPTSCLLSKVVLSNEAALEMSYNEDDLPIQIKENNTDDDRDITSLIEYDDHDNVIRISQDYGYLEYGYDVNNKVISGKIFYRTDLSKGFTQLANIRYTYNKEGLMDSAIYVDQKHYMRYEYDARGYLINTFQKYYEPSENLIGENLKFDDQHIPSSTYFSHYTLLVGDVLFLTSLKLPLPEPHNIEIERVRLNDGSVVTNNYAYGYNELGYPISRLKTATRELPAAERVVTTFVYNCK